MNISSQVASSTGMF